MHAWPLLLGWPAITLAMALSLLGTVYKKPVWLYIAAVLLLPISIYLAATPAFGWFAVAIPCLLIGAGIATRIRKAVVAWLLLLPVAAVFGYLAILVISQNPA